MNRSRPSRATYAILAGLFSLAVAASSEAAEPRRAIPEPFRAFHLPDAWVETFWTAPSTKTLFRLDPLAISALVPTQAGFRGCRCPSCPASEADDTLKWTPEKPLVVTCKRCGAAFPNAKIPAKIESKVTEEVIEVRPGKFQHYPYHAPAEEERRTPDERLYLSAKRDYEARESLAKVALQAALKFRDDRTGKPDRALPRMACLLILRFAQVYPDYALHYDHPGEPKYLQQADLKATPQRGYRTAKWDRLGSLDVPLNLVIAYAIVRDTPELLEAGRILNDPNPARTIERDLFRASAEFVRNQPEEYTEASLPAYRGMLAVARLLEDEVLAKEVVARVDEFSRRGFYHDGFWKGGDIQAHRRVVGQLEGWIDPLLASEGRRAESFGIIPLAREAGGGVFPLLKDPEVLQVSLTPGTSKRSDRRPILLGGAGVARLSVGSGNSALDLEIRAQHSQGSPHFQRQAIRLAVGGIPVLDDLDDKPTIASGWNNATASHNTVVIDGLNQRESFLKAREPSPGGEFRFFAADPDFQVVSINDPQAYPTSARLYRQTVVLSSDGGTSYALGVFEVEGGLRHDQIFHAPSGSVDLWKTSAKLQPFPASLLPPDIPYIANVKAEDGRWFVQAFGEFRDVSAGPSQHPEWALWKNPQGKGVRLHLLGDEPRTILTSTTPDISSISVAGRLPGKLESGRASLLVRRDSLDGQTLRSRFVTLYEPVGAGTELKSVGRVRSSDHAIVIQVETAAGVEWVLVNLRPGKTCSEVLSDGRPIQTDGLAVRVRGAEVVMAGGTFASVEALTIRRAKLNGQVVGVGRESNPGSRGWFRVERAIDPNHSVVGKTLMIRHGDGVSRGWTLTGQGPDPAGGTRLFVREEPGFGLEGKALEARDYHFPGKAHPGPHDFSISEIAR